MIGRVCQCEVSTLWHNARWTLMLMRFYQFRYSIRWYRVRGRFFDWEVFHFSQIVGSFDLLRIWLLVLDVIAARVIPVTRSGMFLRLVIATVQSSEGENKHMCVPFGTYRVSRLVPCLDLASPAMLPMGTSGLQPCTETLFGIISHNYCLSRLFKGMSNSLWLWVGP